MRIKRKHSRGRSPAVGNYTDPQSVSDFHSKPVIYIGLGDSPHVRVDEGLILEGTERPRAARAARPLASAADASEFG